MDANSHLSLIQQPVVTFEWLQVFGLKFTIQKFISNIIKHYSKAIYSFKAQLHVKNNI